jgi:hypothetical protein
MKRFDAAIISAVVAHVLTWVAAIGLAVGPIYQGESATAVRGGGIGVEPIRVTATLIEVNGLSVLPLLLAPVLLTALALLVLNVTKAGSRGRKVALWLSAGLLLGFCVVAIASVGILYLPAALALLTAAIITSRQGVPVPIKHQDE